MRQIWARRGGDMAGDLIAETAVTEGVVGSGIWRLAIHRLLILIELGSLASGQGPLAYVCIKNNGQHGCQSEGPWGGCALSLRIILTSEEPVILVLELDSACSNHRNHQARR